MLLRLFFINDDRTKYVSVCFYPARDSLPLLEFGVVRRGGGPKTLLLSDKQMDALAEVLPILWDAMCNGETFVCVAGARAVNFGSRRTARLYVDSQYTSLTTRYRSLARF